MSEIDFEARQRILKLEDRICELQAILLLTLSEMRGFKGNVHHTLGASASEGGQDS